MAGTMAGVSEAGGTLGVAAVRRLGCQNGRSRRVSAQLWAWVGILPDTLAPEHLHGVGVACEYPCNDQLPKTCCALSWSHLAGRHAFVASTSMLDRVPDDVVYAAVCLSTFAHRHQKSLRLPAPKRRDSTQACQSKCPTSMTSEQSNLQSCLLTTQAQR